MLQHVLICQHNLSTIDDVRDEVKEHLMALGFRGTLLCIEICKSETLITFQLSANHIHLGSFRQINTQTIVLLHLLHGRKLKGFCIHIKELQAYKLYFWGQTKQAVSPNKL